MFPINLQMVTNNDPYFNTPLTFIAVEPSSSIKLYIANGTPAAASYIQYGIDDTNGINWSDYQINDIITLDNVGDKVYFRGLLSSFSEDTNNYFRFATSGLFDTDGNLQSLLNYSDYVPSYGFVMLFRDCNIRNTPRLLASNVDDNGYYVTFRSMPNLVKTGKIKATKLGKLAMRRTFYQSTNLREPVSYLPATNVDQQGFSSLYYQCYSLSGVSKMNLKNINTRSCEEMYASCTSLTDASNLTINCDCAPSSFQYMFYNCSGLTIPCNLPTTGLADNCYYYMFGYCSSLLIPPELPATTLAPGCYQHMFSNCEKLQYCPELPALEVPFEGYCAMFKWCYGLKDMPELPATKLGELAYYSMFCWDENITGYVTELPVVSASQYCYAQMFYQNYGMKTAPIIKLENFDVGCCERMFYNCSGLIEAPELLPTSLITNTPYSEGLEPNDTYVFGCLEEMFNNCISLSSINVNFTEWEPSGTINWATGITQSGNFYCPSTLSAEYGTSRIPTSWNKIDK